MKPERYLILLILFVHVGMLIWIGYRNSPTWDEVAHLPAGLYTLKTGRFNVYSVNPPLERTVAAIPLLFVPHHEDWKNYSQVPTERREFAIGCDFVRANGERSFFLYTLGRWACIPFSLLTCLICFRWAKELYGINAGFLALVVWCFSPLVLGHASLITPDSPSAAFGVTACYCFWHWLKKPDWSNSCWTGMIFGLAQCTKFTFLLWYPLWPLIWLTWFYMSRKEPGQISFKKQAARLIAILTISIFVTNYIYLFDGSFKRLDSYRFVTETMSQTDESGKIISPNRFAGSIFGWVPVPFPSDYVYGIDVQKRDFDVKLDSYLRGEWKKGGWYHYYIYAYLIKEPIGTFLLIFLAACVGIFGKGYASTYRDEFFILVIPLSLLFFISSQTGFNHHLRYLLPAYPFVYIWISKVARSFYLKQKMVIVPTVVGMTWFLASSLYYYPHSLSYFNELVGGPKNGHYHLGNSNIDWGQDLLYLKRWLDKHPEVKLNGLLYDMPLVDVALAGITDPKKNPIVPEEGWYAISVNQIHNMNGRYEYFLMFEPYDRIGYSMNIYNISPEEAKRVRNELGFTDINPEDYPVIEDEKPVVTDDESEETE